MRLGPQQPPSPADIRAGLEAVCAIRNATDKDRHWSIVPSDWLDGIDEQDGSKRVEEGEVDEQSTE